MNFLANPIFSLNQSSPENRAGGKTFQGNALLGSVIEGGW